MMDDPVLEPGEVTGADGTPLQEEVSILHAAGFAQLGGGNPAKSQTTSRCARWHHLHASSIELHRASSIIRA